MSDIFISYKRGPDADLVEGVVQSLRANGFSVWWDRDIPARAAWEETIEAELRKAHIVVVCWSPGAIASENVKSEARWAKERGKLLQTFVAPCEPPLFFGEHQGIQIFTPADLYGPRFESLVSAAQAMIEAATPPELAAVGEKLRKDRQQAAKRKAPASWRRDEPAQPWEASQFGLTLSLLSTILISGLFIALVVGSFGAPAFDPVTWWTIVASGGVMTPLAALIGGWSAYQFMARFPRRVGFVTALILSIVAGLVGALVPLAASGIAYFFDSQFPPSYRQGLIASALVTFAVATVVAGVVLSRLWTPVFLGLLRSSLSGKAPRRIVTAAALIAPIALTVAAIWKGPTALDPLYGVGQFDALVDYEMRRAGLLVPIDVGPANTSSRRPSADERVKLKLGLAPDLTDEKFVEALRLQPDKTEWVLAADGSGDAPTLREIMLMSAGSTTIKVKPGIYRDPPFSIETYQAQGSLAAAFAAESDVRFSTAPSVPDDGEADLFRETSVIGDSDRDQIIFEITQPVTLWRQSRIEGVTIRAADGKPLLDQGGDPQEIVRLMGPASLVNSVIVGAGGDGVIFSADKTSEVFRGAIRDNLITGELKRGIIVARDTFVDVLDNRIDKVSEDSFCIIVNSLNLIAVRGNDLTRCATPGESRIWSLQRSQARISDNLGASDTPRIERDSNGIDDRAIY